ncbi:MAG: ankyrin repeat domain-containing protein [Alphaproteobacteria bacterium]|nr:ankyrin repeat domain-containing protein [Alphaproteobacteria bacterium]
MGKINIRIEKALKEIESLPFQQIGQQVAFIKDLLQSGCDINGQDANGDTLLHIAVRSDQLRGHNTIAEGNMQQDDMLDVAFLSRLNPNPFIQNKQGMTPAMLAAHLKLTSVWQFLTSYEHLYETNRQTALAKYLYQAISKKESMPAVRVAKDTTIQTIRQKQQYKGHIK